MSQPEKPPEPSAVQRFFGGIGPYPFVLSAVALGAHGARVVKAETDEVQKSLVQAFRAQLPQQYPSEAHYPSEHTSAQPPPQPLPLPQATTTTTDELPFPPPTQAPGHKKKERTLLYKTAEHLAAWGYTPWFGVAALDAYRLSQQGQFGSAEAFVDWVHNGRNVPEEWRREFVREAKALRPVSLYMVGLGRCLPLFGLVWLAKRIVKPTEDDKVMK
ncbi:uncharacterized protein PG986_009765 [Apiospora aurea]|uniref:Uncharacterized protein n=1 Tax=Apiospora aurea TaxID=335848 RepID=A0ABR1Q8M2_9PEZI